MKISLYKMRGIYLIFSNPEIEVRSFKRVDISSKSNVITQGNIKIGANVTIIVEPGGTVSIRGPYELHDNVTIIVHKGGALSLAPGGWISSDCWIEVGEFGRIEVGDRTTIQRRCDLHGSISIGEDVLFAPECYLSSGGHTFDEHSGMTIREQDEKYNICRPIVVERNSWLGIRAFVAPGVHLKEGSIVGANSVVAKSVDVRTVVAGIPATKVRSY